jgi:hypothetical protein
MIVLLADPLIIEFLPLSQLILPIPKVLVHAKQLSLMPKNMLMQQQPSLLIDPSANNAVN